MRPESRKFLADALDAVAAIEEFTRARSFADMGRDKLLRSGIYWQFTVIGEALSQLRRLDEATFDRINESWRIVGFRNQIIHGYQVIQDNVTWQIVQDKLPILRRDLEQLLAE
jgi:uncharacterized protein with HEPN domain